MDDRGWEARDIARIAVFAALIVAGSDAPETT